jgi:3-phenylpropionate/trans-cinnamate dioxygenase ferredoxin subunit
VTRELAVAKVKDLVEGQGCVFQAGGHGILVCLVKGGIFALDDRCTHDDGPLGEGHLDGHQVECPRHGARFDVRDGRAVRMPAVSPVKTYPVRVEGGQVFVEIDE